MLPLYPNSKNQNYGNKGILRKGDAGLNQNRNGRNLRKYSILYL